MAWKGVRGLIIVAVLCHCVAPTAGAQPPTLFTNRSTWAAAAGSVNTITFEGIAPPGLYAPYDDPAGLPLQGVRFLGSARVQTDKNYLRVVDANYSTGFNWGSGAVLHGPPGFVGPQGEGCATCGLLAAVYAGITWLGTDVMSFAQYGSQIDVTVTLFDGNQYVYTVNTPAYPQRGFVGFISTQQIFSIRFVGKTGFPTIDNFSLGGPTAIGPPKLTATVAGSNVAMTWSPAPVSAPVTSWVLEVATTPLGPAILHLPLTNSVYVAPGVPNGTYFVRVYGVGGGARGPSSNEVRVFVGPCSSPPGPPTSLAGSASNGVVSLAWSPPASGCAPTGYLIRAGSAPGLADVGIFAVGLVTSLTTQVRPATYYVAILAQNGDMVSAPSNEVVIGPGCTVPAQPTNIIANVAADFVTLMWTPPAGPVSRYLLEVGTGKGLTDIGTFPIVTAGLQVSGASGTYWFRVKAENACGIGPASEEKTLTAGK